jgi:hypothetical protein
MRDFAVDEALFDAEVEHHGKEEEDPGLTMKTQESFPLQAGTTQDHVQFPQEDEEDEEAWTIGVCLSG